ncbi:hypothetical protein MLD38_019799 [Melastoma candidum]|uniref:Uncharacterized protein n=1 Tax=Melastoma candidum TaxID=119954 RepID=A0ACB9QAQ4_9MYRT|nr:hypothetical protein MLD38_019799 [Melastoma candidum]
MYICIVRLRLRLRFDTAAIERRRRKENPIPSNSFQGSCDYSLPCQSWENFTPTLLRSGLSCLSEVNRVVKGVALLKEEEEEEEIRSLTDWGWRPGDDSLLPFFSLNFFYLARQHSLARSVVGEDVESGQEDPFLLEIRWLSASIPGPCIIHKRGADILHDPWFNKDTGFPLTERDRVGLRGLLPPRVISFEQQYARFN